MKIHQHVTPQSLNAYQRIEGNKNNNNHRNDSEQCESYPVNDLDASFALKKLYKLAKKLSHDCYTLKYSSSVLARNFIIGIESIRRAIA